MKFTADLLEILSKLHTQRCSDYFLTVDWCARGETFRVGAKAYIQGSKPQKPGKEWIQTSASNRHTHTMTKLAFYHFDNIKGLPCKRDLVKLIHAFISSRLHYFFTIHFSSLLKQTIYQLQFIKKKTMREHS